MMPVVQAHLGDPIELLVIMNNEEFLINYKKKTPAFMTAPANGRSLYLIEPVKIKKAYPERIERNYEKINKAAILFEEWNDGHYSTVKILETIDTQWKKIALVKHIIYQAKKWNTDTKYIHEFVDKTYLWAPLKYNMDHGIPEIMKITGKYLRITSRGIEG